MTSQQSRPDQSLSVQVVSMTMIELFLNSIDVKYRRPEDDCFVLEFDYNDDWGCSLTFVLGLEGDNNDIYIVRCISDRRIPKKSWGDALVFCNMWNNQAIYPTARLYVADPEKSTTGNIVLDFHLPLVAGIHQRLLNSISHQMIIGSMNFWKWLTLEQEF